MTKLSAIIITLNMPINLGLSGSSTNLEKYPETSYVKILTNISEKTHADILYHRSSFEIWGLRPNIKDAYKKLMELDWILSKTKDVVFQFELAESDREFIKGKRDGKLTKITNLSHCSWNMQESHNGFNFLMTLKNYPNQNPLITFGLFEVKINCI
jgi:hypothetical protein